MKVMQDIVNYVIEVLKQLPIWVQVLSLPILLGLFFIIRWFKGGKKAQFNLILLIKKILKSLSKKNLEYHDLFISLAFYKSKILTLDLSHKDKTKVFKIIYTCRLEAVGKNLLSFIKNKNYSKWKDDCFNIALVELTQNIWGEFENMALRELEKEYPNKNYLDIYKTAVDSEGGFGSYNNDDLGNILMYIEKLSKSGIFDNNYEKLSWYFDILDVTIKSSVLKAEENFRNFNGNFENLFK